MSHKYRGTLGNCPTDGPLQQKSLLARRRTAPASHQSSVTRDSGLGVKTSINKVSLRSHTIPLTRSCEGPRLSEAESSDDDIVDDHTQTVESKQLVPDCQPSAVSAWRPCALVRPQNEVWHETYLPSICRKRGTRAPNMTRPSKRQQLSPPPIDMISDCSSFNSVGDGASGDDSTDSEDDQLEAVDNGGSWPCPIDLHGILGQDESRRCCGSFTSTRRIRKHLIEHHRCKPLCPVCGGHFATQRECNAHIVRRACELSEVPPVAVGLSEGQVDELECLEWNERLTAAKRYRSLWNIVFPGEQMPSVALDTCP